MREQHQRLARAEACVIGGTGRGREAGGRCERTDATLRAGPTIVGYARRSDTHRSNALHDQWIANLPHGLSDIITGLDDIFVGYYTSDDTNSAFGVPLRRFRIQGNSSLAGPQRFEVIAEAMTDHYPILHVAVKQVIGDEQLGTKTKFWFDNAGNRWLFKESREIQSGILAGEDWSEKVAAEIARVLGIPAAEVELAEYQGRPGCASKSFTSAARQLMHGNEILEGCVSGYDRDKRFKQSAHTLENILRAFQEKFFEPEHPHSMFLQFASYCVLDALICNVDRHHENWGLLWQVQVGGGSGAENEESRRNGIYQLAPSYDHASSLGRELTDEVRLQKLRCGVIAAYVRRGRGGIYKAGMIKGENPLTLVKSAAVDYPDYFRPALGRLRDIALADLTATVERVPVARMSGPAREFTRTMLGVTYAALTEIEL